MQIQEVFDRRRFVFLDGGMGTQLQQRGLQPGQKPELASAGNAGCLNSHPHAIIRPPGRTSCWPTPLVPTPKSWLAAAVRVEEVVSASIACARRAGQETSALVALDIGPLGELLAPSRYPRF